MPMDLLPFFYAPASGYYRTGPRHDPMMSADISDAKRQARRAASTTEILQGQVDRLALAVEALWTLLRDSTGITDEQLRARIKEIDLSDGKLDGKVTRAPSKCPDCGRTVAKRHLRCIYCGKELEGSPLSS